MKKLLYLLTSLILLTVCVTDEPVSASSVSGDNARSEKVSAEAVLSHMAEGRFVQGELLVKIKSSAGKASIASAHRAKGATVLQNYLSGRVERVKLAEGTTVQDAILEYMSHPDVEYAEPNYIRNSNAVSPVIPNDIYFGNQWSLLNKGEYAYGTAGADMKAAEAWNVMSGSSNVVVAVMDTGIDYHHSDLSGNIWLNLSECNGIANVDDDGNGFIDDCRGFDFTTCEEFDESGSCISGQGKSQDADPMDDCGHGTHVAGIIGAVGHNATGITGVMWDVSLMNLKVLNSYGQGSVGDIVDAIEYVVAMRNRGVNVRVINASWGGTEASFIEKDAIQELQESVGSTGSAGVLFVAAAGNGNSDDLGTNNDLDPYYPASYSFEPGKDNMISVAATDQDDRRTNFSNYGLSSVDVAAPGHYILSTIPGNSFADKYFNTGTSMAAPHVSGLAGLLASYYHSFEGIRIRDMLLHYVDRLPTLEGWIGTGGRINAFRSMSSLWLPENFRAKVKSSSKVVLTWKNRATDMSGHEIERRTGEQPYTLMFVLGPNVKRQKDTGLIEGTKYDYRIRAFNGFGKSSDHPGNEVSVVTPLYAPINTKAEALSPSQVRVTWQDNSQLEAGFIVERKTMRGSFERVGLTSENTGSFVDSGLSPGTRYIYRVKAYNSVAESAYTKGKSVQTPRSAL
jgi:subtilisin family serine protease